MVENWDPVRWYTSAIYVLRQPVSVIVPGRHSRDSAVAIDDELLDRTVPSPQERAIGRRERPLATVATGVVPLVQSFLAMSPPAALFEYTLRACEAGASDRLHRSRIMSVDYRGRTLSRLETFVQ